MRTSWTQEAGPARLRIAGSVPGARWDLPGKEAAAVQVRLDGRYHQDVVLCRGDEEAEYERLLGDLAAGAHHVDLRVRDDLPPRPAPRIVSLEAGPFAPRDDAEALALRHCPWIYTRRENDPWESLWTDTPLLLFYRLDRDALEFQCVYSNEDAGTDTRGLLAEWGRTTDIEWVLRLDRATAETTIQGRSHITEVHRGTRVDGRLTLQVVGRHGMVSSEPPTGAMRCLFLPRYRWDDALPRETAMDAHPWTYRLTALEMIREGRLMPASGAEDSAPGDLRDYAFVQVLRSDVVPGAGLEIVAAVRGGGVFSSTHGQPSLAIRRPHAFSTTIKLPHGAEVEALAAVAHPPIRGPVRLRLHRAFRLDDDYRPRAAFARNGPCAVLREEAARAEIWRA